MLLNNKPKKRSIFQILSLIMIYFLAVSSIFSPLRALTYYNLLWAFCIVGWFALTALDNPRYVFNLTIYKFAIYFYVIYTVAFAYLTNNGPIGNRFFQLAQLPLFYMAYEKNKLSGWDKDNRILIALSTPFILITCYLTLNAYRINPMISRAVKKQYEIGVEYMKMGIGGYHFIYFLVIAFAILLFFIFNKYRPINRKLKILGIGVLLVFAMNIILSNYSLAFLILIVIVFMRIFFSRINVKTVFFYSLPIAILLFFSNQILLLFLDNLQSLIRGSLNASHILELKYYLSSGYLGNAMYSRYEVFNYSIQSFIHNPIFGTLADPNIIVGVAIYGNHSQIFDTFAFYGLGIGVLQLYIYLTPIKERIVNVNGSYEGLPLLIMLLMIILFTLNNATPSIGFALYFIFPTVYDWIHRENFPSTQVVSKLKMRKYVHK